MTTQHETQQLVQFGILVATLGLILSLIGLYPSITGVEPKTGIGVVQILILILGGMPLTILGGMIFVKVGFYSATPLNLAQRIAIRVSLTGLLFAAAVGMSDVFGYGSNPTTPNSFPVLGVYQSAGMVFGFGLALLGVMVFLLAGPPYPTPISAQKRTTDVSFAVTPELLENYKFTLPAKIRPIELGDAQAFLHLQQKLDAETPFMLLEAGERETANPTAFLEQVLTQPRQMLWLAEYQNQLIGYLEAVGGRYHRNQHCATLVVGVLPDYQGQGVGTRLFEQLEPWAKEKNITRLELTVMAHNHVAIALYHKLGFVTEGSRKDALIINEQYVDELYMAKILREKTNGTT